MTYAIRFNNHFMQTQYENLIRDGYHWRVAERKVIQYWSEN